MPLPLTPRIKTLTQLDNHTVEIQTKDKRAYSIYLFLTQYDYDIVSNTHPMPNWAYTIPTNKKIIRYENTFGEMAYDGNLYSSLSAEEKVIFWQWIDKAIVYGMKQYDKNYGF